MRNGDKSTTTEGCMEIHFPKTRARDYLRHRCPRSSALPSFQGKVVEVEDERERLEQYSSNRRGNKAERC